MHSETEHLLICLMEETAEIAESALKVSSIAGKTLRFGLDEVDPGRAEKRTNMQRLSVEINDFLAVVEKLDRINGLIQRNLVDKKHEKLDRYIRYARDCHTIGSDPSWLFRVFESMWQTYGTPQNKGKFITDGLELAYKEAPSHDHKWMVRAAEKITQYLSENLDWDESTIGHESQIRDIIEREYFTQ